ncbi:hypothetical protein JAAARDRAFT_202479 [Jaapia argillacea MUCL 33604]|uniref:Uncharacterized protein n=1 Tax=Jaapia argillacea MUCL 33604 TaxID=933084 RepID=A0A067Q7M9_9AGAM|nr:hypothetical protein JAAARDRAFT_202479 [Jaapia argillacea MUCL 33604]
MFNLLDKRHSWRRSSEHSVLPIKSSDSASFFTGQRPYPKRYRRLTLALLTVSIFGLFYCLGSSNPTPGRLYDLLESAVLLDPLGNRLPPLYERWHEQESRLPQHDPDLPFPEGKHAKFFWVANHVTASGWGNSMQETLFDSHIAYAAKRSFVFVNYTWNTDGSDYTDYNGKLIPSRIPLSALITGPTAGAPYPPGSDPEAPRAVSKEYFDRVCPHPKIIHSDEVLSQLPPDATASQILQGWVEKLDSIEDRCVEVDSQSRQIFSIWTFGSRKVLDIWPTIKDSPILTGFGWSPLIHAAYENNKHLFLSPPTFFHRIASALSYPIHLLSSIFSPSSSRDDPYAEIPGLLAIHIRKGDFASHCDHLATWNSVFNGFNQFPSFPDKFTPPPNSEWGSTSEENRDIYMSHCFPSIEQIVDKIEVVRKAEIENARKRRGVWLGAGRGGSGSHEKGVYGNHGMGELKRIYVMTNAKPEWIEELREALRERARREGWEGWEAIVSSREVALNWEQKYVAQSVDMMVGQKAQVLIGNGFSSLTSNIVMLRMARDFPPESIRFW